MSARSGTGTSQVETPARVPEPAVLPNRLNDFAARLWNPSILVWGGLLLLTALYIRTTAFDFVYDDLYIVVSPRLDSWNVVFDLFRHDIFGSPGNARSVYFRPLSSLGLLVVKQVTGGSPAWFHLAAIGIHLCIFYLAYVLGRLLLRDGTLAAFAALLFALHPGKVETVAWVSSALCDGVGASYFFGVLIGYLKWQQRRSGVGLAASVLCFAAAMFTKETLFVAAVLVLVHFCWTMPQRRVLRTAALALPYALVLAGYMACRRAVLQAPSESVGTVRPGLTLECLWNGPAALLWYLRQLVCPTQLSVMYDYSNVSGPGWRQFVLPLLGVAALCAVSVYLWYRRRSASLTVLSAWFLMTLAAYVAFSPMVRLHDRYLYLASYPFCVLAAWLILHAGKTSARVALLRVAGAVLLLALWATVTWRESGFWRDELTLWGHATHTAPGMVEPWLNVATIYSGDLKSMRAVQIIDEGLKHRPKSPSLWQARGLFLYQREKFSAAKADFLKVFEVTAQYDLRKYPDVLEARAGAAYYLGRMDLQAGDYLSAEHWLRVALALRPNLPEFQQALRQVLRAQGRLQMND